MLVVIYAVSVAALWFHLPLVAAILVSLGLAIMVTQFFLYWETLVGMPWGNTDRGAVYHTPADTVESVSEETVAAAIGLAEDLARQLDGELAEDG